MAATRTATVTWTGDLTSGSGTVSAGTSELFTDLPVSWASRTEQPPEGRTSPEELLAAAHASCFAMALSSDLAKAGNPPEELHVSATVTFDRREEKWTVVSSALDVIGSVPGLDAEGFDRAAEGAKDNCPVSQALKGNVEMSVHATLEE
jgi:osmotically inducible protein OsmC